jgi:cytochrome c-type biogenesis protein CcmF
MDTGDLLLRIALVLAALAAAVFFGELRGRRRSPAPWIFAAHAGALVLAFGLLVSHFLARRFEYDYVAQYSSRALSPALAVAASWAGQEGSFLLWAALAALLGLALMRQPGSLPRPAMFFVSLGQVALLVLIAVKSPFERHGATPLDGQGLNPLLEDPWMVAHPPVLFVGYAAALMPYALAAAAVVRGEVRDWNRTVWPWALAVVVALGTGIAMGGVWAYKVLGWGGYWGWDPVENASLVPWLISVALLHGLLIQRVAGGLARTNLLLAFGGWAAVLGGTYLTRSGVLQNFSVHSFTDSGLGLPLMLILAGFALAALGLLAPRWTSLASAPAASQPVSRESALWLGMITVLSLAALVAIGTCAPLITSLFGPPGSVQTAFYSQVAVPLGIALVVLMALSPALRWHHQQGLGWSAALIPGLIAAALIVAGAMRAGLRDPGHLALVAVAGLALGVNARVAFQTLRRGWTFGAGYLGHVGVAIMVLGMALSTGLSRSEKLQIPQGGTVESLGYRLSYRGTTTVRGGRALDFHVEGRGARFDARPALLESPQSEGVVRKPAIDGWRELYLSPIDVKAPRPEGHEVVWLPQGENVPVGDATLTFVGFRMEPKPEFQVVANLEWRRDGRVIPVSPAVAAGPQGSRPIDASAPGFGTVSLAHIDADHGRVAVALPAPAVASVAMVDFSTKPFINLVWIGALLTLFGTVLSALHRAAEQTPRAVRTSHRPARKGGSERHTRKDPVMSAKAPVLPAVILALLAVTAALPAAADEASPPATSAFADTSKPVMFLKQIVVTGARYPRAYYESPQALSFVSRWQLRELDPVALGDALASLPGVDNSKDSPWEQRPVLRGLSGQRVLVLMDGSPMNSARGNGPHPSLVDPGQVERIEVVRGPSSVAYGSDALGGVINIITRDGAPAGDAMLRGRAEVGGSSAEGQRRAALELMPRIGRLSAFIASGVRRTDDLRTPEGVVPNSSFDDYNALANLRYELTDKTALKAGYQLYRGRDIGIPGLSFAMPGARQDFSFAFYDRDYAHVTLDHGYRGSWLASTWIKAYWQREHRDFYSDQTVDASMFDAFGLPPRAGASSVQTLQDRYFDLDTYGFQTQLVSARMERARFSVGLDAVRDATDGDNVRFRTYYDAGGAPVPGSGGSPATAVRVTASVPDGRFDSYAGFMQSDWFLSPRWTLSAGGRYTHYRYRTDFGLSAPAAGPSPATYFQPLRVDDGAVSGSLGLVYEPIQNLHLTANVANGYRQPNAQDLFFNGPASVGVVLGNPVLDPERSVSYDLGLRWGPGSLALAGNLFYSTYRDLIDAIQVAPGTYQYVNISDARIWGGEAEAEWRPSPQWSVRATAAGAIGDITSGAAILALYGVQADRAPLPSVPPFRGTAALRWRQADGLFWVEPGVRYAWRTNRLPLPTPGVEQFTEFKPEWIVGDLLAGVRITEGQRLQIGVRNFTDNSYRQALASVDDPGISVFGSLSTDF